MVLEAVSWSAVSSAISLYLTGHLFAVVPFESLFEEMLKSPTAGLFQCLSWCAGFPGCNPVSAELVWKHEVPQAECILFAWPHGFLVVAELTSRSSASQRSLNRKIFAFGILFFTSSRWSGLSEPRAYAVTVFKGSKIHFSMEANYPTWKTVTALICSRFS